MIRTLALTAVTLGILATGASAQMKLEEVSDSTMLMPWNVSAEKVEDMDVMANGKKVGEVENVVGTSDSAPTALVVDFEDDAGYGDRDNLVIPVENFSYTNNMLALTAAPAAMSNMQAWDD